MKRRILNFLLLAVMLVVGMSAKAATTTVGNTDNTSGFWTAFSDYYTIPAGSTLHVEFVNHTDKAANFHNWVLAAANAERGADGYYEYFALRADNYAWGDGKNTGVDAAAWAPNYTLSSDYNWETFASDMEGATVVMEVTNDAANKKIKTVAKITTADGLKTYTETFVKNQDGLATAVADPIKVFLTTEGGHLIINDDATTVAATADSGISTLFEAGTTANPWTDAEVATWTAGGTPTIDAGGFLGISGGNGSYETSKTFTPSGNSIVTIKALWRGASSTGRYFANGNGSYFRVGNIVVAQNDQDKKHAYTFAGKGSLSSATTFTAGSYRVDVSAMPWLLIEMKINPVAKKLVSFSIKSEDEKTTYVNVTDEQKLTGTDLFTIAFGYNKGGSVKTTNKEQIKLVSVTEEIPKPQTIINYGTTEVPWTDANLAEWTAGGSPALADGIVTISGGNGSYETSKSVTFKKNALLNVKAVWRGASSTGRYFANGNGSYFRFGNIVVAQNDQDKKHAYTFADKGSLSSATTFTAGSYRVDVSAMPWLLIEMTVNTAKKTVTSFTVKSEDGKTTYASASDIKLTSPDYSIVAFGYNKGGSVKTTNKEQLKSLVITETEQLAVPLEYTVNIVEDDDQTTPGNVLETYLADDNDDAFVDVKIGARDKEKVIKTFAGERWLFTSCDSIVLQDDPLLDVLEVKYHKALNYDWKVVGKYDDKKVFDIEQGYAALEGDTLEVTYRQFYVDGDGIGYKAAAAADGRFVYRFPIVMQKNPTDVQVDTVYYTKVGPVELSEEIEDAPGLSTFANAQCSGGYAAYNATDDFVKISETLLTPGTYKMTAVTCDQVTAQKTASDEWFIFNAVPRGSVIPTEEAVRLTPTTRPDKSDQLVWSADYDITIKTPAYLYMKGGKPGIGLDYIMITRTGDLNEASGYVSVPDSLTGDAVTEMETINSADFDVYVSPSQFVEIDGKRYLQMENGTITVQCTTGRAVKDVKFIGLPEGYTWDYATADLGTIDSLHWTMQEGFDKVIFTFTKPSLIAGISVGGYLPGQAKVYYKNDYEEAASTTGWTSSVGGRYTPVILDQDGNHYLSVDQDSRYNNGAVVTGSVLKGALPEDVTDFTLEFDMRLGGTNQQFSNLQFQDAQGKAMLKLTLTAASSTVWSINDKADMTLDLKNSGYTSGGRNISTVDWYSYQLSHKDGLNYLTVTHKESGEKIYDMEPLESDAVDGGMGNIVFTSARYFANIAFDNIVLRELLPSDVPNVTISQYTIKYVAEDGAVLHDDITTNAIVGTKVAANAEQIAPIVIDEKKYIYASGNDSLLITDDAAANILTLNFRVAKVFNYTARGTSGEGILGVFERGTGNEGDVVTVAYPRYVLDKKGRLWARDAESSQYRTSATLTKDKQMINLAYDLPAEAIENVIFYSEGENLTDALKSNAANTVIRSSNAGAGFYTEDTKILTLKPGSYTITAVGFFGASAGGSIKFTDGTQTLFMVSSTGASNGTGATGEIELTEVTPIYLAAGSNTVCLDYFYIQTEDGGIATDGIADVKAGYEQGAVYNLKGQKVADSLEGLQPGLYLVNGKKVTVK